MAWIYNIQTCTCYIVETYFCSHPNFVLQKNNHRRGMVLVWKNIFCPFLSRAEVWFIVHNWGTEMHFAGGSGSRRCIYFRGGVATYLVSGILGLNPFWCLIRCIFHEWIQKALRLSFRWVLKMHVGSFWVPSLDACCDMLSLWKQTEPGPPRSSWKAWGWT